MKGEKGRQTHAQSSGGRKHASCQDVYTQSQGAIYEQHDHDKLARLAQETKRSRSYLADVAEGKVIPHGEAMADLQAIIDAAERCKPVSR